MTMRKMLAGRLFRLGGLGAAILGLAHLGTPASAAPWEIDPKHSYVHFEVVHLGLIPYPGRFRRFTAEVDYVPDDVAKSSVEVRIPVKSLETDDGLLNETMLGDQFFNERNYDEIRFVSRRIVQTGEATADIEGDLTMIGNTRPVTLKAVFAGEAKDPVFGTPRIGITAETRIDRVKWGLSAWRPFVDREVLIRIGLEATPK